MAKAQPNNKGGKKDKNGNGSAKSKSKGKSKQKTPKVAAHAPKIAAKQKKPKAKSKKKLIQQEKASRKAERQREIGEIGPLTMTTRNQGAGGGDGIKKQQRKERVDERKKAKKLKRAQERQHKQLQAQQQQQQAPPPSNDFPRNGSNNSSNNKAHRIIHNNKNANRSVTVDLDGIPLHHRSNHVSNRNNFNNGNNNNYNRGRSNSNGGGNNNGGGGYNKHGRPPFQLPTISNPKRGHNPWWRPESASAWETERLEEPPTHDTTLATHYLFGGCILQSNRTTNGSKKSSPGKNKGNNNKNHNPQQQVFALQTWLSQLDAELEHFQDYVQVSEEESAARDYAVNCIQHVSQNNLECVARNQSDQVRVQVFGSYATKSVCAFCSDVDMALFGVVPPDNDDDHDADTNSNANVSNNTHIRFGGGETTAATTASGKNTRIQKWRDVIDECFADVDDDEEEDDKDKEDEDAGDKNDEKKEGMIMHQEEVTLVQWQNKLDQMLEGSNEGPDTLANRKRALSTASSTIAGNDPAFFKDIVEEDDKFADANEESGEPNKSASSSSSPGGQSQFADANEENDDSKPVAAVRAPLADSVPVVSDNFFVVDREGAGDEEELPSTEKALTPTPPTTALAAANATAKPSSFNFKTTALESKKDDDKAKAVLAVEKKRALSMNSEKSHNHSGSDSEEDTADPLASLAARKRQSSMPGKWKDVDDDDDNNNDGIPKSGQEVAIAKKNPANDNNDGIPKPGQEVAISRKSQAKTDFSFRNSKRAEQVVIDLSSSSSASTSDAESENEVFGVFDDATDDLHVAFVSKPSPRPNATYGPQGATKAKVVKALRSLSNILRRREFTHSIQVIGRARVPILKFETKLGFEGDIAMGGHNGTDTSQFARSCVERYKSFATVVMALKILLRQNNLDAPFIGGLGSFKLYVLVAHHLERHLAMGGNDRPGEVFLGFFVRYGNVKRGHGLIGAAKLRGESVIDSKYNTSLQVKTVLKSDDGYEADLNAVFLLHHCVELFNRCWSKIAQRYNFTTKASAGPRSILVDLFDVEKLMESRSESQEKANKLDIFDRSIKRRRNEPAVTVANKARRQHHQSTRR